MNCAEVRELLLESDLSDLTTGEDTPLSRHLQGCPECRSLAQAVVDAASALGAVLDPQEPETLFEEAVVHAVTAGRKERHPRLRALPVLIPLAAVAALFILLVPLLFRQEPYPVEFRVPEVTAELPALKAPPGKTAMILDSGDPDYQIIWLFESGGD